MFKKSLLILFLSAFVSLFAQDKPNILLIVSDDTGWGDLGPYGGGEGRGMPTPNFDKIAAEGMTFFSFYGQPSCTPGRAAIQTGRIPNRSGMTTVAFQGQGGGLPAAEWTLASVLKTAGYKTYFTGKWHLGEEQGENRGTNKDYIWIVDPLDGTTNFMRGIPHFAVSIALRGRRTLFAFFGRDRLGPRLIGGLGTLCVANRVVATRDEEQG